MATTLLLAGILVNLCSGEMSMLGPWFASEPPALVRFAAAGGVRVHCAARGDPPPALSWLVGDGSVVRDVPGLRRVYSNGTLEILPSSGYQSGATTLRCRAANAHGVALSRDVTLQPVSDVSWEAAVSAPAAAEGGVAALTCSVTRDAGLVDVAVWYRGDRVLHVHAPTADSRYIVAGNTLLLREASAADAGAYSCLARHSLTATTKRSAPAYLSVTPGLVTSAPRLVAGGGEVSAPAAHNVCLPCVSSEHPPPHYTWYREWDGRLQPVEPSPRIWLWAGGAALCMARTPPAAAGVWLCKAYNAFGDATAHTTLVVQDSLTVTVEPTVVVADTGSTARFNCSASDPAASLSWLHDGAPAGAGADLVVRGVARAHRGVYQCIARRAGASAQAAAELRLGEFGPELHYTFIEQALRVSGDGGGGGGGGVSLRCAATGAPLPRFAWLLDAQPLDQRREHHRYFISEEASANGDVVSILNISNVAVTDGGRYTCRAQNDLGHAEHSARLNIYGPPSIRALGAVRVVAGANATVYCPYAGYPISSISWWRRGASAAVGGSGRVSARGAALRLAPALPADAGRYACAVAAPDGPVARNDIDIQVRNPPKISPFIFSSELTEGSSVQVLCGVSSGDKPMYFSWLKDGSPPPPNLQIEEKSLNEFSLLMFSDLTAQHSGDYTCRVSNHAATVNYTATLSVKVTPAWTNEPLDAAVLLGAPLLVECAAKGYPTPTLTWYRRIGDSASLNPEGEQWEQVVGGEWGGAGAVSARNGRLIAPAAARAHQGLYRCLADNGVGPPLFKQINITVHEPAHFEGTGTNVSSVRGRSAALVCRARGDAPLTLHWMHLGNRLDLNSYRWTVSEVRTAEGVRSTLQLRAAEREDTGEYRCHAHNQYGRSELFIYLHVEEPPEAPGGLRLGGVGSRWVRLVWLGAAAARRYCALYTALHSLPGAEPRHNTVNLTVETPADEGSDADGLRTLASRLAGLRPAVSYSLRIAAANHVGQSPHSEPLLFTTLEEAPTTSPQNVRVRPGDTGELHVSWSAPPQDGWNGELLGYVVSWRELGQFEDKAEREEMEEEAVGHTGSATVVGWSSGELVLAGLSPFARYAVTLRAYNCAGAGPHSPAVYATTADGVPESSPTSLSCEAMAARALRVRWAPLPAAHAHTLRGYNLHYAPLHYTTSWSGPAQSQTARVGLGGEATLQDLRAATNYSVWVHARADAGLGPPSPPVYCTTREDVPGAVEAVRALASSADAVRVTWLAPAQRAGMLTHYTLYTRELGKESGEWAQRVDAGVAGSVVDGEQEEVWREVRGLRERTVYEFWVRAATAAGAGAPSRSVTAAPAPALSARIASLNRAVWAARGARARLRCSALGTPPLRWRWSPLPHTHTVTDAGDLIIHKVELQSAGNYTCQVRNGGGSDALVVSLGVLLPPATPAPRLLRADTHALHLAWDPPPDGGAAILGYTVRWYRGESDTAGAARSRRVGAGDTTLALRGLACGALYRVTLRAHNLVGASPHSPPLLARTVGDKVKPPPGKEFVWANSTTLRLNLLAWAGRCPVTAWTVALRPAAATATAAVAAATAADWLQLHVDAEAATASNLRPGSWYEIRVVALSPAGDTVALYRAATHTSDGERIGEAVEVPVEAQNSVSEGAGAAGAGGPAWRAGLAPALGAAGLAALLAALAGLVLVRRRQADSCLRRECSPHRVCRPHPQLYSTEPGKRNGKASTSPDGELHEISPYATFSMSGGGGGVVGVGGGGGEGGETRDGCALHLHTFGRAEPLDLAAPPPRPNLLAHTNEYGRSRDSDSESSGSPCAACAAELYRLPAAHLADTLPAVESSTEDTSYSAGGRLPRGGGGGGGGGGGRHAGRARRRREPWRHDAQPTVRYSAASAHARRDPP